MAHRIDGWVKAMETADRQAVLDRIFPKPQLLQLPASDHSVLSPGQLSDASIHSLITRPSQPAQFTG